MHANLIKKTYTLLSIGLLAFGCAHNPNKAEKIDTSLDKSEKVTGNEAVGVKDGNMVVQNKVNMAEQLRDLQIEVYTLEDKVYGNREYGSLGLYGVLRDCRSKLADKANGGDGHLIWTEPIDRVTDKEEDFKIGLDEKDKLVGVTEEFLKDRIERFRNYRNILQKRQDEYEQKLEICQTEVKSRKFDVKQKDTSSN